MDPNTKTYFALVLVFLALLEFWAAMRIFGKKPPGANPKLSMRLHRAGGYVFLIYFMWISWVCVDLMGRLAEVGQTFDSRAILHGALAMTVFVILLLKISFIRIYNKFRNFAPLLGIIVTLGTLVLWGVAGWMYWIIVG